MQYICITGSNEHQGNINTSNISPPYTPDTPPDNGYWSMFPPIERGGERGKKPLPCIYARTEPGKNHRYTTPEYFL